MGRTKDLTKRLLVKVLGSVAVFAAAILMFSGIALQAEAATAKITASSVRVRKEASTSSEVVTSVSNGDSFTIQSEVTGSDGYVWYKISVNNQLGYIRSDLAQKSEGGSTTTTTTNNAEVTEVQPISAKVTGGQVRVRPDASTNGSAVTTVAKDTVVTVNGMTKGADNKTWYKVSFRSGNNDINGFIREDFLQLAGELVPVVEEVPENPDEPITDDPVTEVPDTPVVETKDYETFEAEGKWYLVNNTTSPAYQYEIEKVFEAAETNAKLYEDCLKKVKAQKVFIIILILVLVAVGVGATLIIFKMKDMLDEAYYDDVEKEVAAKRQNKQQNVMHTVGKDSVQKKPTVNGQQRPAGKPQSAGGQGKPMPKPQPGSGVSRPAASQAAGGQSRPVSQQRPAGAANPTAQARPTGAANQAAQPRPAGAVGPAAQPRQAAAPQTGDAQKPVNAAKPKQEWKSKNFMTDDDEFEYDFLNWDGEEEL